MTTLAGSAGPAPTHLDAALAEVRATAHDVRMVIGSRQRRSSRTEPVVVPHEHRETLGRVHYAAAADVTDAIEAATAAATDWSRRSPEQRAEPFLRAADLLESGPWRDRLVAATMLELSKTVGEAEGDGAAETADFLRANVANAAEMAAVQPHSPPGVTNRVEYRPLEGFVFAVTPFNFTSMNNLAFGPALLGNTVVWKPAESASLVAYLSLQLLREAGLPDGVVNLVPGDGAEIAGVALAHRDLAAVHFTGSTPTFRHIWRTVGQNIDRYRDYPRIVGETGGKDFVVAHHSADVEVLAVACVRGAYGYQGQKCAAASRLYVPRSMWPGLRDRLVDLTDRVVVGDPTRPGVDLGGVINARQHAKHAAALARARHDGLVVAGGNTDDAVGWFVEPTLLEVTDPLSPFMTEELFAPVLGHER